MPKRRNNYANEEKIGLVLFGFVIVAVIAIAVGFQMVDLTKKKETSSNHSNNPIETINSVPNELILENRQEKTEQQEIVVDGISNEEQPTINKEKDDFEIKYYIPTLLESGNTVALEGETYKTTTLNHANDFLKEAYNKIKLTENVSVTELLTFESGTANRTTTQTLREMVVDYKNLSTKHTVSKKSGKDSPVVLEENYSSSDGVYRSYLDNLTDEKLYMFESYDETVTRDNLLSFTNIELDTRSPFHLLEMFHQPETRPQGLKVGENNDFFVFYKEREENIFGTLHYNFEAYLFDKLTYEPLRYFSYEKQIGETQTDYSMKEVIYSDYNQTSKIKVPKDIQAKALGIEN